MAIAGVITNECLVSQVTAESIMWFNESSFISAGMLPEAGGLNDQWEIDLQAYQIVMAEKEAHRQHGK